MAKKDHRDDVVLFNSKFSSSMDPQPEVRKWLKISYILGSIMGAAFVVAYLRNYYASNSFLDDAPFPAFVFLAPLLLRLTYYSTKRHFQSNWQKLEAFGGFGMFIDYDSFFIMMIKLFLAMSFFRLIAEFIGHSAYHSFMEKSYLALLGLYKLVTGN
ncbi:MAG: hypothetical protein ABI230_03570 [Aestuariivirga sp.]